MALNITNYKIEDLIIRTDKEIVEITAFGILRAQKITFNVDIIYSLDEIKEINIYNAKVLGESGKLGALEASANNIDLNTSDRKYIKEYFSKIQW